MIREGGQDLADLDAGVGLDLHTLMGSGLSTLRQVGGLGEVADLDSEPFDNVIPLLYEKVGHIVISQCSSPLAVSLLTYTQSHDFRNSCACMYSSSWLL